MFITTYVKFIVFTFLFLGCSSNIASTSRTTLVVDYYGVNEATTGEGWDNPLNVERLLLGNSRPLTVIFATPGDVSSSILVHDILSKGLKDKVWIIDSNNPTSSMLQSFMSKYPTNHPPFLLYINQTDRVLQLNDRKEIVTFLTKFSHLLSDISAHRYYD